MANITEHTHILTQEEISHVQEIICEFLGADELYGGCINEGRIVYHYEYSGKKCTTVAKLLVKVEGDFSAVVLNEEDWDKPHWIEFSILPNHSADYFLITDDEFGPHFEVESCYYRSFATEICAIVQDIEEMEYDCPFSLYE